MSNGVTVFPATVEMRQHPIDFASQDDLLASVGYVPPLVTLHLPWTHEERGPPGAVLQSDGFRLDKRSGALRGSLAIERNVIG